MAIDSIIGALGDVYADHFHRGAGDLWIKRVTETVPEVVTEWPWLFFVCDEGDVELMTFASDLPATPRRRQTTIKAFGQAAETERRPKLQVTHRFKAQLLVRPRRDLAEDETLVRPFIEPVLKVTAENLDLGETVGHCKPTGYKYGVFSVGKVDERAVEFIGIEFSYEAQEVV